MKRPEEHLIEECDPDVVEYINHLEKGALKARRGKFKKALPILLIEANSQEVREEIEGHVENSDLQKDYHVVVTYGSIATFKVV